MEAEKRKVIDIMGNTALTRIEKATLLLRVIRSNELGPEARMDLTRYVLESYGMAPRHERPVDVAVPDKKSLESIQNRYRKRVNHELEGWFEIQKELSFEKTVWKICTFLEEFLDEQERAVVFSMILASKYIPVPVNYFSRFIDEEESDHLLLREYAGTYIKLRQLLNLKVGPTCRGSLVLEFLQDMSPDPKKQAIVLGAFLEELLRRLKNKKESPSMSLPPGAKGAVLPFSMNLDEDSMQDFMNRFRDILPPEVLDQLRRMLDDKDEDDNDDDDGELPF